ncbi:MAG TPA: metal-dependent hydrolase [Gemmatimonadota bacterium]|nr:metal-dependent hydrolase [Gemmatimonadota bacterium]
MARLTWHGHACFEYETTQGKILIDPFLSGNPKADVGPDQIQGIHAIVVSHGHGDHWGDTVPIAKRTGALVVAAYELAALAEKEGCKAHGLACGGGHRFDFGHVKLVPAAHGSRTDADPAYSTNPCGIAITAEDKILYHAGDTALTADIKLLGQLYDFDCACLPIGDNYTMGPDDALKAVQWLQPDLVVPMHYDTFELIAQDAVEWKELVERRTSSKCEVLKPGGSVEF